MDDEGRVEFVLQNTVDVTELYRGAQAAGPEDISRNAGLVQRAEAVAYENLALGKVTEFFQAAFEQAPGFMAVLNDPKHVFRFVNRAYMNLIGARDVVGLPVREAMPDIEGQGKLIVHTSNVSLDEKLAQAHPDVKVGQYIRLAVTDTGCGMSKETADRIFEPFFTTKENGHETGLGLTGGPETILLVEDDEVRETAFHLLTDLGYKVLQASDAVLALSMLAEGHDIDLLFTDVVMPGKMNGHELAQQMHNLRPEIPVLFMSGFVQDAVVHDGRLVEGVQLIGKPYTQAELARKVREIIGRDWRILCMAQSLTFGFLTSFKVSLKRSSFNLKTQLNLCILWNSR